ncbi:hypothetical protein ABT112_04820 [Streptomyces sp. NPDC002055]|uniref:hypothetical protein n=1 Tax=Streptomyces sp. NPDC002055 TaxID=3154534 RepID=UPI00333126E0
MKFTRLCLAPAGAALMLGALAVPADAATTAVPCDTAQLIAAINAANSGDGATLALAAGCAYHLTTPADGESGLPVIVKPITLEGNGVTISRDVDADEAFRIFTVGAGGELTLEALTVEGGLTTADGGGILVQNDGALTVDTSLITGNTAAGDGGGIAVDAGGTAALTNTSVTENSVADASAAAPSAASSPAAVPSAAASAAAAAPSAAATPAAKESAASAAADASAATPAASASAAGTVAADASATTGGMAGGILNNGEMTIDGGVKADGTRSASALRDVPSSTNDEDENSVTYRDSHNNVTSNVTGNSTTTTTPGTGTQTVWNFGVPDLFRADGQTSRTATSLPEGYTNVSGSVALDRRQVTTTTGGTEGGRLALGLPLPGVGTTISANSPANCTGSATVPAGCVG